MSGPPDLAVIANHTAGRGRAADAATRVRVLAEQAGHVSVELDARDAASTRTAVADLAPEVRRVVAVGGDGLVHHVVQHLATTDRALGIVPTGTGNDFASAIGIPTDRDDAIRVALGPTRPLDAIRTDHGWAASIATAGFSAVVNARADRTRLPLGSALYTVATLLEVPRLRPWTVRLRLDDRTVEIETVMLAIANTRRFGGGMTICPDADPTDGLLDITSIGPVGRLRLLRVLPQVFDGSHVRHPEVSTWRAREVEVDGADDLWADGERLGPSPAVLTAVPGALRVAMP